MARSIMDLSWDELDAIAQVAAEDAIDRTHDAGLATFGFIEGHAVLCNPERKLSTFGAMRADAVTAMVLEPQTAATPFPEEARIDDVIESLSKALEAGISIVEDQAADRGGGYGGAPRPNKVRYF